MDFVASNWYVMVALSCVVAVIVYAAIKFFNMPSKKQIANLLEFLKIAVVEAEKSLGTGTGQLKLRVVYETAIIRFPWVETYVSFDKFSGWVDEALVWMKQQIESNKNIASYVNSQQ